MEATAGGAGGADDGLAPDSGLADEGTLGGDGTLQRLDARWVSYRRVVGWLSSVAGGVGLVLGATLFIRSGNLEPWQASLAGAVVAIVSVWRSHWWPAIEYRYASYRLGRRAFEIRRGVLWRSVIDVPRSRIQHSDVSQGPIERRFGLGTLSVYTAGTRYALVRLHGLAHARALEIREDLLQTDDDDVI